MQVNWSWELFELLIQGLPFDTVKFLFFFFSSVSFVQKWLVRFGAIQKDFQFE